MKHPIPSVVLILFGFVMQADAQVIWQKLNIPEPRMTDIQASPNGKLFLMTPTKLYTSLDEGSTWNSVGSYPVKFVIDSQGILYGLKDTFLFISSDDGASWQQESSLPSFLQYKQFFLCSKDYVYVFTDGPRLYTSANHGKNWDNINTFWDGFDLEWSGAYLSPLGKLFGSQSFCSCMELLNATHTALDTNSVHSTCTPTDNEPPESVCFDYGTYGYLIQTCDLLRSADTGYSWQIIDSDNHQSKRYWPPYIPLLNSDLLAVTDTATAISHDHADTWAKIGNGIIGYYSRLRDFVDRKNFVFIAFDSALYRLSLSSSVHTSPSMSEEVTVHSDPSTNEITIHSPTPLDIGTASLYSIDGKLLKRAKMGIVASEDYSIDMGDVHTQVVLLVLQTSKGVITKKILLY
jgi:hypothetical protein